MTTVRIVKQHGAEVAVMTIYPHWSDIKKGKKVKK